VEIKVAVERILEQRKANLELMNEEQCAQRTSEIMKAKERNG
jgi:hypothetical protein